VSTARVELDTLGSEPEDLTAGMQLAVELDRMSRAKNVPALSRAERVRVRGPR
jgi:hypothetical protein